MSQFTNLPSYLLTYIFDCLTRQEFNALLHVCSSLYHKTLPHQYRDITFRATASRGCSRRLSLLLRSLIENPQLSAHVKCFRLCGHLRYWSRYNARKYDAAGSSKLNLWGLEGYTALSKAQTIFASNLFYRLVDEETRRSVMQFSGHGKDALATLMLTRFTELEILEIEDGFLVYSLFLPHILKQARVLLPKLKHIILGNQVSGSEHGVSYTDLDLIRPIFYHSTMETFEWVMSQPWQFRWNQPQPPRSESLVKLCLYRSNIHRSMLAIILASTPALKSLTYEQEIPATSEGTTPADWPQLTNLDGLTEAIAPVHSTLQELRLTIVVAGWDAERRPDIQPTPIQGTLVLNNMTQLKTVHIPMLMILGWFTDFAARPEELLPPNVEHLTLRDDFVTFTPWSLGYSCIKKIGLLGDYAAQRRRFAPHLRGFRVRLARPKNNDWLEDAVADISPVFGRAFVHEVLAEKGAEVHCWRLRERRSGRVVREGGKR